jgi:hypothetical protein
MKKYLAFFILFVLTTGCATVQPPQKSNLTAGMVKTKIIKGQTTQNEIIETFGAPNIITKAKSGNEVWTYDKVSIETSSSEGYGTIIIVGIGSGRSSASTRTFTLMIEFDDNDIVKDYSYRSSAF